MFNYVDLDKPYRIGARRKEAIARNLIAFMDSKEDLSLDAANFIHYWVRSDKKYKAHYDVWDLVLREYIPLTRPTLYRSCKTIAKGKIASFTGRIYCADRFKDKNGFLIICDTFETLGNIQTPRNDPRYIFFPLAELVKKEADSPNSKFSKSFVDDCKKEDEYIMRAELGRMYCCKWLQ